MGSILDYKPEYSIIELGVDEISLEPSSTTRRLFMKPGNEPGPDGDGRWRLAPMPGEGARRGGVARPKPESVSTTIDHTLGTDQTRIKHIEQMAKAFSLPIFGFSVRKCVCGLRCFCLGCLFYVTHASRFRIFVQFEQIDVWLSVVVVVVVD